MKKGFDIKKAKREAGVLLKKTKKYLKKAGEEAAIFAKRSEEELSKLANLGRAEADVLGLTLKKNRFFYDLGRDIYELNRCGKLSTKNVKKMCDRIDMLDKDLRIKRRSVAKYFKKKS